MIKEIRLEGQSGIELEFAKIAPAMRMATSDVAKTLRMMAQGRSPVDTGAFKSAWTAVERTAGGYSFENPTSYGIVLEEGLYGRVGPRTAQSGGKVYSRQAVGGVLEPLIMDDGLINRCAELVVAEIKRAIGIS